MTSVKGHQCSMYSENDSVKMKLARSLPYDAEATCVAMRGSGLVNRLGYYSPRGTPFYDLGERIGNVVSSPTLNR